MPIQNVVTVFAGVEETPVAVTRLYLPLRTLQIRSKYAEMSRANQQKHAFKKTSSWLKDPKLSVLKKTVYA